MKDKCLGRQKLPQLTQEETDHPTRSTISKDTGVLETKQQRSYLQRKPWNCDSFTIEFSQTLKA